MEKQISFIVTGFRHYGLIHLHERNPSFTAPALFHSFGGSRLEPYRLFVKASQLMSNQGVANLRVNFRGNCKLGVPRLNMGERLHCSGRPFSQCLDPLFDQYQGSPELSKLFRQTSLNLKEMQSIGERDLEGNFLSSAFLHDSWSLPDPLPALQNFPGQAILNSRRIKRLGSPGGSQPDLKMPLARKRPFTFFQDRTTLSTKRLGKELFSRLHSPG